MTGRLCKYLTTFRTGLIFSTGCYRAGYVVAVSACGRIAMAAMYALIGYGACSLTSSCSGTDYLVAVRQCTSLILNGMSGSASVITVCGLGAVYATACVVIGFVDGEGVSTGLSLCATKVTDRIVAIIILMIAADSHVGQDLICNVCVAAVQCTRNVNVEHVVEHCCVYERMDGSDVCQQIQYIVCLDGHAVDGDRRIQRCVDHIIDQIALIHYHCYEISHGDGNGVYVVDLCGYLCYVCIADVHQCCKRKLCLGYGQVDVNDKVNSLVVLIYYGINLITNRNVDLIYADCCNSCNSFLCFCGKREAFKSKLTQNLCQSEVQLCGYELIVDCIAVVVTQNCNACIGIDCVDRQDRIGVCLVAGDELIQGRLCCEDDQICYGDLHVELGIITQYIGQLLYGNNTL